MSYSQAACWLDMQMTCRAGSATGDFRSRLGYTKQACAAWLDRKKQEVFLKLLFKVLAVL